VDICLLIQKNSDVSILYVILRYWIENGKIHKVLESNNIKLTSSVIYLIKKDNYVFYNKNFKGSKTKGVTIIYFSYFYCLLWYLEAISLAYNQHNTENNTWRHLVHRWGRTASYCIRSPRCRSCPGNISNHCCSNKSAKRITVMYISTGRRESHLRELMLRGHNRSYVLLYWQKRIIVTCSYIGRRES
jgi:hypothetical protein